MEAEEFEAVFRRLYPQLVNHVRRTYDPSVAEDLASKTMETVWVKDLPAPTDDHSYYKLRRLAFAILYRLVGHHMRQDAAHRRHAQAFTTEQTIRTSSPDPSHQVAEAGWPSWTNGLREEEKLLLGLHANGYKPAEIAPELGIRPSAVSARLQRLKEKARMLWREESEHGSTR